MVGFALINLLAFHQREFLYRIVILFTTRSIPAVPSLLPEDLTSARTASKFLVIRWSPYSVNHAPYIV